jgi:putative ABC transport system ATP-binding protein
VKPIIELKNLYKDYSIGNEVINALKDVNLTIYQNEYTSFMGPSGSGKSTLMNIIGCLDTPTRGTYFLDSRDVSILDDNVLSEIRNKEIGFVFQSFNLISSATVYENIEIPLLYGNLQPAKRRDRILAALEEVSLLERKNHKPNQLSGGQKQRVAIARAIVQKPSLVLADEPTGNLDSKTGAEILDLFSALHEDGNTIIVVTHEDFVAKRTERIIRLFDGMIESDLRDFN